jgi:predicted alpha/beta superfamily hydrolase
MGEDRIVNIVLPEDYAKAPAKRYPVLYVIDGGVDQDLLFVTAAEKLGSAWGRSGDAIVVGIATKDRRAELTGPTADPSLLKQYPTAGHSAQFRAFIRDEVKPFVSHRYRTNGTDAVTGESLAGLFIVETYMVEPGLFTSYGAVSPSSWWDNEALSLTAAARIGTAQFGHPLYLAVGNEGVEVARADGRIASALSGKVARWCYAEHPDLTHSTIYHSVSPELLQFVLPPAQSPPPEFGFEVRCSRKS